MRHSSSRSSPSSEAPAGGQAGWPVWSQTGRLVWSQTGRLAWSQAGWFVLVVLGWSAFLLTVPVDPDYTAGELLDHLLSWRETGALYPALGAEPALRVFNYPPLVMLAVRGLVELGVPGLMAGRLMNAAGLVALVSGVAWWVRARGTIVGTVGLLGASFPLLYAAGQFHIELWAAALTLWGFALLDRATRWPGIVTGALALTAACFAKQTQVVPALVALAWTWTHRRDVAVMASVTAVGAAAFGATALTLAWGVEPWRQMVTYTVGTYSIGNLGEQLRSHVAPWAILIGFAARVAWARDRGPDGRGAAHGAPHGAARGAQLVAARVSERT